MPHSKVLPIVGLISALSLSSLWLMAAIQPAQASSQASHQTVVKAPAAHDTLSPFKTPENQFVNLPAGPLVVEAFAPWCEFCATTARFEDTADAQAAHLHHLPFVMVDVSRQGGVGHAAQAPTYASIRQTAHDGPGALLTTPAAIAANLRAFLRTYPVPVPVLFDPAGAPTAWHLQAFPTFLVLNAHHRVVARLTGFQKPGAVAQWLERVAHESHGKTP